MTLTFRWKSHITTCHIRSAQGGRPWGDFSRNPLNWRTEHYVSEVQILRCHPWSTTVSCYAESVWQVVEHYDGDTS